MVVTDEGGGAGGGPVGDIGLLADGLLGCIARALSRSPSHGELVSVIVRDSNEAEIKNSWLKLFNHSYFSEAFDSVQKKKIRDINRQTSKNMVDDIVTQLDKVEKKNDLEFIVLPWSYSIKEFESDSEKLTNIMAEEKAKDIDARFDAFERKIEKKNSELYSSLQLMIQNCVTGQSKPANSPPTFAGVVCGAGQQCEGAGRGGNHSAGSGVQASQQVNVPKLRGRSPSVKRPRVEQSYHTGFYTPLSGGNQSNRSSSKPKPVVGTSNPIVTGRKMRSPPADIFVWGVHPETSIEDIVNDLAESGIVVKDSDIIKKSKEEAYLCSYKISVPAADLAKALDPAIWPLRVKVREFIHYARKRPTTGQPTGGQPHSDQEQDRPSFPQGGHVHAQAGSGALHDVGQGPNLQVPGIRVENMFGALAGLEGTRL